VSLKPLFVYGTLRASHPNSVYHGLAGSCDVTKDVVLPGFNLYDLGSFPGVRPGEGSVVGDVFMVPEELWDRLDQYEGVPHLYTRETVELTGFGDTEVYVYGRQPNEAGRITSGNWLQQHEG